MPKEIVTVTVVAVEFDGDSEVLNQRVDENETVDGVIGDLRQEMVDQMNDRSIAAIFTHVDRVILPDPVISQATDATQSAQQVGTRSQ